MFEKFIFHNNYNKILIGKHSQNNMAMFEWDFIKSGYSSFYNFMLEICSISFYS